MVTPHHGPSSSSTASANPSRVRSHADHVVSSSAGAATVPSFSAVAASGDPASGSARGWDCTIEGEPPNMTGLPPGCPFHPRCDRALEICGQTMPPLEGGAGRLRACHAPLQEVA